jgi:hypothetical protein
MQTKTKAYARYWRNSLSDAELGKGALSEKYSDRYQPLRWIDNELGRVDKSIVDACFAGEPEDVATVELLIRPLVYRRRVEHGATKAGQLGPVRIFVGEAVEQPVISGLA